MIGAVKGPTTVAICSGALMTKHCGSGDYGSIKVTVFGLRWTSRLKPGESIGVSPDIPMLVVGLMDLFFSYNF